MTHTIETESLRATVDDHGAELISVYDKERECERIWCADPAVWNHHAPILFPFVGQVSGKKYRHNGQEYEMRTQHGFAWDRDFMYTGENEKIDWITHRLVADEKSLAIYPFPFDLKISHCFAMNRMLVVDWKVKNCGTEDMFYSIGGHPGFTIPIESGLKRDQFYLQFLGNDKTKAQLRQNHGSLKYIRVNSEGLAIPDKKYTLNLEHGFCPITQDFFDHGALIFENPAFAIVRIALPDKSPYVSVGCMDFFPYAGIWSKPKGNFVCLAPWAGRTDDAGFNGELKDKTGECVLAPGEAVSHTMVIQFH